MTRVRVEGFTIFPDGYGADPNQDINNPQGVGGTELHIAITPVLLDRRESLPEGVDLRALRYECVEFLSSETATHVVLRCQGMQTPNYSLKADAPDVLRSWLGRKCQRLVQ